VNQKKKKEKINFLEKRQIISENPKMIKEKKIRKGHAKKLLKWKKLKKSKYSLYIY
jgi:hypothetical protein